MAAHTKHAGVYVDRWGPGAKSLLTAQSQTGQLPAELREGDAGQAGRARLMASSWRAHGELMASSWLARSKRSRLRRRGSREQRREGPLEALEWQRSWSRRREYRETAVAGGGHVATMLVPKKRLERRGGGRAPGRGRSGRAARPATRCRPWVVSWWSQQHRRRGGGVASPRQAAAGGRHQRQHQHRHRHRHGHRTRGATTAATTCESRHLRRQPPIAVQRQPLLQPGQRNLVQAGPAAETRPVHRRLRGAPHRGQRG